MTDKLPEPVIPTKGPTVVDLLELMQPEIGRALPALMDSDRFTRIVLTVVKSNEKLMGCDPMTLLAAVMLSAQLGLEPGPLGHSYFVPYGRDVTFILGYKGMIHLALQSERVSSVEARCVFEGDDFDYAYGLNDDLTHKPCGETDPGKVSHSYAIAKFRDGGHQFIVTTRDQIEAARLRSPSGKRGKGPWVTDYAAMAAKTSVRRLAPFLPQAVHMHQALAADETVQHQFMPFGAQVVAAEQSQLDRLPDVEPDPLDESWDDGDIESWLIREANQEAVAAVLTEWGIDELDDIPDVAMADGGERSALWVFAKRVQEQT